jgi:N-dimethylarginine dimethylaminohydrolase
MISMSTTRSWAGLLGPVEDLYVRGREVNVARVGSSVWLAAEHVRTADRIHGLGLEVQTVELSEFAKAEGGVTCLSILFQPHVER